MKNEHIEQQIERCRRLKKYLTDDDMRDALDELAADYEARLKHEDAHGFMLRD